MQCQGQRGILEMRFPHPGKFMFHAHQSEFTELGWMGSFDVCDDSSASSSATSRRALMEAHADPRRDAPPLAPAWLLGLVPLLLAVGVLGAFAVLGGPGLGERPGPAVEELSVERTVLEPGSIKLTVRNDGPDRGDRSRRPSSTTPTWTSTSQTTAVDRLRAETVRIALPLDRGRGLRGRPADLDRRDVHARDRRRGGDAERRPRVLRAHGAARDLRRRHPGGAGHAVAAVRAPRRRHLDPRPARRDGRPARLPRRRRDARGARDRRPGPSGPRRRRPRRAGRRARLPGPGRRLGARLRARRGGRRRGSLSAAPGRARGARHRTAQPRGGPGHRFGVRHRSAGARRVPRRRLRDPQHDGGPGHRRPARAQRRRASVGRLAVLGLLAGGPAVLGAWIGAAAFDAVARRLPARRRRWGHRPGDRPDRPRRCATRRAGSSIAPSRAASPAACS